jgi:hypothetical protein
MSSALSWAGHRTHDLVLARAVLQGLELRFEVTRLLAGKVGNHIGDTDAVQAVTRRAHGFDFRLARCDVGRQRAGGGGHQGDATNPAFHARSFVPG